MVSTTGSPVSFNWRRYSGVFRLKSVSERLSRVKFMGPPAIASVKHRIRCYLVPADSASECGPTVRTVAAGSRPIPRRSAARYRRTRREFVETAGAVRLTDDEGRKKDA